MALDPTIPWGELALAKWELPEPAPEAAEAEASDGAVIPQFLRDILASHVFLWLVGIALVGVPLASMLRTELERRRMDRALCLSEPPAPFVWVGPASVEPHPRRAARDETEARPAPDESRRALPPLRPRTTAGRRRA